MKKNRILGIAFIFGLVLAAVALLRPMAVYRFFHPASRQEVIERVFKDQEIFGTMTNSSQVTAQRLHGKSDGDRVHLSSYNRDVPVTLTAAQAWQIKSLLREPSSYVWDVRATCTPDYGMVYNFRTAGHSVRVAFCFKCNIIGVFSGENDASNRVNFTSQFNPMRGQIITLSKTLFPNDSELQALK